MLCGGKFWILPNTGALTVALSILGGGGGGVQKVSVALFWNCTEVICVWLSNWLRLFSHDSKVRKFEL